MRIGKQQEEGLCESVTMVAQDGQTVRSKPMTLGELQHFLQDIRGLYEQLAWKSCEYFYARAGNLGRWQPFEQGGRGACATARGHRH